MKKLKTYVEKEKIEAYRIYQKDIPEYPYLIDIYGKNLLVYEQGKKLYDEEVKIRDEHLREVEETLIEIFSVEKKNIFFKAREVQKGANQYVPSETLTQNDFVIHEGELKFYVNLEKYLDTGLFLDHRPTRKNLLQHSKGKKVLNLFSYTCSLSVAAAKGGAKVTSVDMSRTYLDWGVDNFKLNGIDLSDHMFCQADVLKDLGRRIEQNETFDLILLDPPSFSNSKRMEEDLDIMRDHPLLIRDCLKLLTPDGELFFSTNKRKFELHPVVSENASVKKITHTTIPQDFYGSFIHESYLIKKSNPRNK